MKQPAKRWWSRAFARTRRVVDVWAADPSAAETRALTLTEKAERKAGRQRGRLAAVWDDLTTLMRLARAWAKRDYRDVGWGTIALVLAAILYFVNPFDLIPDVLPLAGFIDDATILGWVVKEIRGEIEAFRAWEAGRLPALDDAALAPER